MFDVDAAFTFSGLVFDGKFFLNDGSVTFVDDVDVAVDAEAVGLSSFSSLGSFSMNPPPSSIMGAF